MSEIKTNASRFVAAMVAANPGDRVIISGKYAGTWRLDHRIAGIPGNLTRVIFDDVTLDATATPNLSAFNPEGQGEPAWFIFEGKLTLIGGYYNFRLGRSEIDATGLELFLHNANNDALKVLGSMEDTSPLPWWVHNVHFGFVSVEGASSECVDNTGGRDITIDKLHIANTTAKGGLMSKNRAIIIVPEMQIYNCTFKESAITLGGICANTRAETIECFDSRIDSLSLVDVVAKRGLAFTAANKCHVKNATATGCVFSIGAVVGAEAEAMIGGGKQRLSEGCSVNGFPWVPSESPWLHFPPVPVEPPVAPPVTDPLEELTKRMASLEDTFKDAQISLTDTLLVLSQRMDGAKDERVNLGLSLGGKSSKNHTHDPVTIGPAIEPTLAEGGA